MSLFNSIQLASAALQATQIGLQVTGNNIANANTPGYIREQVVYSPARTQTIGTLTLGLGVEVTSIRQQVDQFLKTRLRNASSDTSYSQARESAYARLETVLGELGETDLSTSLNRFFGAIQDVVNQPESIAVRNLAVLQGTSLAQDVHRLNDRFQAQRADLNSQVVDAAKDISRLLETIAKLNIQIVSVEGGNGSRSDAVGLRDQRYQALDELASIIDIRAYEQDDGSVSVLSNSDFLAIAGTARSVRPVYHADRGLNVATLQLGDVDAPLDVSSGKLAGLTSARDEILGGALDELDRFAQALAFEFNRVFTNGQGLTGYRDLVAESSVANANQPLDQAGLAFEPVNGSFQVQVRDDRTGLTKTTDVLVQLTGLDDDTTLANLAAQLDAIDGLAAAVNSDQQLELRAETSDVEFSFAKDTSGILTALGLNTFFSGTSATNIGVRSAVREDPTKFAASLGGIGVDTDTAVRLAELLDSPLTSTGGASISELYQQIATQVTQGSAVAKTIAEGDRTFHRTLESEELSISGVNLDEEAVNMIALQRAFQATARVISTVSDLLEILVKL